MQRGILIVTFLILGTVGSGAQRKVESAGPSCPKPFPAAKFYLDEQPDSPLLIRDLSAVLVQNPSEPMAYKRIRVQFYFENRTKKKIVAYGWDNPSPDESKWPSGGYSTRELLPGESERETNTFHTQNGPSVVFRISQVKFADGTVWEAAKYSKRKALGTQPVCVVPEIWPNLYTKRSLEKTWSAPIFSDRTLKTLDADLLSVDGIEVQSKLIEIKRERLAYVATCSPSEYLERILGKNRAVDFDVEKYSLYLVQERPFAYRIRYEFVDEVGQYEIGTSSAAFFVDTEGDGRFTLFCEGGNITPPIPSWVRDKEKSSRK